MAWKVEDRRAVGVLGQRSMVGCAPYAGSRSRASLGSKCVFLKLRILSASLLCGQAQTDDINPASGWPRTPRGAEKDGHDEAGKLCSLLTIIVFKTVWF